MTTKQSRNAHIQSFNNRVSVIENGFHQALMSPSEVQHSFGIQWLVSRATLAFPSGGFPDNEQSTLKCTW